MRTLTLLVLCKLLSVAIVGVLALSTPSNRHKNRDDRFSTSTTTLPDQQPALTLLRNLQPLDQCTTETQARKILEQTLVPSNSDFKPLFQSISIPPGASAKGLSDGDLAIQTRLVNRKYSILELIELSGDRDMDRFSYGIFTVFVSSSVAAILAQQNLPGPEIFRFVVVWLLTFAPLAIIGYGIRDAEKLQAILVQVQRWVVPAYRQRMIQHEAGHILMAHLIGFPIQGYTCNAVRNAVSFYPLADPNKGQERARQLGFDAPKRQSQEDLWPLPSTLSEEDISYFSKAGRGSQILEEQSVFRKTLKQDKYDDFVKLPSSENDPTKTWPYRGFDEATVDKLTIVSVAGVCAELLAFGNAQGGVADLQQLRQIFQSSQEHMTDREIENRIRFALAYTLTQLRMHLGVLDALAEVMERNGSMAECVVAMETSPTTMCGVEGISGDYELERRLRFQKSVGLIEKNMDVREDRFTEGKGGGDRKQRFVLTGDDPLYAALFVSVAFLAWASMGGLSLH